MKLSRFALLPLLAMSVPAHAQLLIPQEARLIPDDSEPFDHLGRSVSVDGVTLVVGARDDDDVCPSDPDCNSGSVHVFVRDATGWICQQKITAGDAAAGDDFGESVALWGDTLVVGAPGVDAAGNNGGAVYVYTRAGTVWSQQGSRLIPSQVVADDCFGGSVGLENDLLIGGARFHDSTGLFDAGSAYVYQRTGTTWNSEGELVANDPGLFDQFGTAVDAGMDRVVIGVPRDDAPVLNSGSVYVFTRSGTTWSQAQKLTPMTPSGSDEFGTSVSVDKDRLIVGSPFADRGTVVPGAAYIFENGVSGWTEMATIMSVDLSGDDRFGVSVDTRGGLAVIGASMDNHLGVSRGSCYVYSGAGSTWTQEAKLLDYEGDFLDEYGISVSTDGTTIGVGSWLDDDLAGDDQGAAIVYQVFDGVFQDYCFGDGGDQMGCSDCPCGNNAKPGSRGGCLNSTANSARIAGFGVPSVMNDTLRIEAVGCAPLTFGLLTGTINQLPVMGMCPPGSGIAQPALLDGLRCGGGGLKRHGTRATDAQGDIGITNNGWGGTSPPPIGLIAQGGYCCGETRRFQITYRDDPLFVCGTALNTTNAISVTLVP